MADEQTAEQRQRVFTQIVGHMLEMGVSQLAILDDAVWCIMWSHESQEEAKEKLAAIRAAHADRVYAPAPREV